MAGAERRSGGIPQVMQGLLLPLKPHLLGSKQTEVCTERCCKDCLFILRGVYWKDTEEPHGRQIQEVYQALWDLGNCQAALLSSSPGLHCLLSVPFYLLVSPFQRPRLRPWKRTCLRNRKQILKVTTLVCRTRLWNSVVWFQSLLSYLQTHTAALLQYCLVKKQHRDTWMFLKSLL